MTADSKHARVLVIALLAMAFLGCQPTVRDDQYRCSVEDDCPPGMVCFPSGFCSRGLQGSVDGGVRVDAFAIGFDASRAVVDALNTTPDAFARDANALSDAAALSEGFACTNDTQCAEGLLCALNAFTMTPQLSSCRARCVQNTDCGALGWCSNGACNRACDPIARDCPGAGTCQYAGFPSTPNPYVCALTVPAPTGVGGACMFSVECGTGLTCARFGGASTCRCLCDVVTDAGCTASSDCVAFATPVLAQGRNIGVCNP